MADTGGSGGSCTTTAAVALTRDQRATPRPQGTQCDPGAFETLAGPVCGNLTKTTGAGQPAAITLNCAGTAPLTYGIVSNPSHGALSGLNASTGAVTYTPTAGYFGPDSFTYNATNAGGTSSTVTASITVNPPPPTCSAVQSSTKIGVPVSIHLTCSDAAGATLSYAIDAPPSHGGLSSLDQATGNVTYSPASGFSGNDSFTYHATSSNGTTSAQQVTIFVSESGAPPPAPTCRAVQATTGAGAPVTVALSCTDQGGAALTYAIDANPAHGALSAVNQTSNSVIYTPAAGFKGTDGFTYHATSVNGSSEVVAASIGVGTAPAVTPAISSAKLTNTTFAVDTKGKAETPVAAATKPKPAKKGTTFQFKLNEAARVLYTIELAGSGRSVKGKCVKPSKSNRKAKKCTRFTRVGRFAQNGVAGANSHKFSGKIGKTTLKPGTYRATLVAKDSGGRISKATVLAFKIVKK